MLLYYLLKCGKAPSPQFPPALPYCTASGHRQMSPWTLTNYKSQGNPRRPQHKRKNNSTSRHFPGASQQRGSPHKLLSMEKDERASHVCGEWGGGRSERKDKQKRKSAFKREGTWEWNLPPTAQGRKSPTCNVKPQPLVILHLCEPWIYTNIWYFCLSRDKAHWDLRPVTSPQWEFKKGTGYVITCCLASWGRWRWVMEFAS